VNAVNPPRPIRRSQTVLFSSAPLWLALPLSFLKGERRSRLGKFFTAATALSTFVSTMMLLLAFAGSNGASTELRSIIAGLDSHILVFRGKSELMCGYVELISTIENVPSVVRVAPYLWLDAQLQVGDQASEPITLKGIVAEREIQTTSITPYLKSGNLPQALSSVDTDIPLVIGKTIADELGISTGTSVTIVKPGLSPRALPGKIVDIFETGVPARDSALAYTTLAAARKLHGMEQDCINGMAVKSRDPLTSHTTARAMSTALGNSYSAKDWSETYPNYRAGIDLLKRCIDMLNVMLFAMATAFSTGAVLLVLQQKRREIAMLLTLGMTPASLRFAVGIVGTLLGFVGALGALVCGPPLCALLTQHQVIRLPEAQATIAYIPFLLTTRDTALIIGVQILAPAVFGWWVVGDLNELRPADILRDE